MKPHMVDGKGRISLGVKFSGKIFGIEHEDDGCIKLIPLAIIPESMLPKPALLEEPKIDMNVDTEEVIRAKNTLFFNGACELFKKQHNLKDEEFTVDHVRQMATEYIKGREEPMSVETQTKIIEAADNYAESINS